MLDVIYNNGLYLPDLNLWLDASGARDCCVISHAHADHIASHRSIVATPETARLFRHRCGAAEVEILRFGERRDYGRYTLTFFPAGHCLGAAQVLIEADGERLVYTGDFKLRPNLTAAQAEIIPCDTLVMESTFGEPQYRFPPESETAEKLCAMVARALREGITPVVLAYALGKSQEAIEWLLRGGFRLSLHGAIWSVTEIYREMGIKFSGDYEKYERGKLAGRVLVTPPGCRKQPMITSLPRTFIIMLTGWAMGLSAAYRYTDVDMLLPLSDHADYNDLVRMAQESGAQRIFTLYGKPKFASRLRELGLNAVALDHLPVSASNQLRLF
jgi:Beta-lactamase superfamily domain